VKTALITGVAGQHGSYMADLLLSHNYKVVGLVRPRTTSLATNTTRALANGLILHSGDLLSPNTIHDIVVGGYDEVYHFAATSHVEDSFRCPVETLETNTVATARLLEALRRHSPQTRLYFAGTSEMMPTTMAGKQAEGGQFGAHSPYAASKVAAFLLCQLYREAYGMHVVTGITFNSESPRRGPNFVTQKICQGVAAFKRGGPPVRLATLKPHRDWHHAWDTVRGIHAAMRFPTPDTYVFASGESHSVGEWADLVCQHFEVPRGLAIHVESDMARPQDVLHLCGDPSKAERVLGWTRRYSFASIVTEMCEHAVPTD
jgi:GDPmannose 4,6-dehydratase